MNVYLALKNHEKGTHFSSEIDARDPWPCVTHLTNPYMVLPSEQFNQHWYDIRTVNLILSDTFEAL